MRLKWLEGVALITLGTATIASAQNSVQNSAATSPFTPQARTIVLAHNAYPDHGQYSDRLDRAIASGVPFTVEEDLAWADGKSILVHGVKNAGPDDPTLETYFFPRVKPVMEKALRDGNHGNWPLITLYLDIKNDPPEHLQAINTLLHQYDRWLTTAEKGSDLSRQMPLRYGPMLVLVEDKQNDIKQKYFYDDVAPGSRIRVFGSVTKPVENPNHLPKLQFVESLATVPIDEVTTQRADNYHRWWGIDWAYVEKGGEEHHGTWGGTQEERLRNIVEYGHHLGYVMSVYCLDGFTAADNQAWEQEYNFGSLDEAKIRWQAARAAHVDLISTDQYELLAATLKEPAAVANAKPGPDTLATGSLISQPGPSFRIPQSELSQNPTVIIFGDQRFTDPANTKVTNPKVRNWQVQEIARRHPDAVLMNGDVPYSGDVVNDYEVFHSETAAWRQENLRVYPALGNHEFHGDPQQALEHWWNAFPAYRNRRWYSVQLGDQLYTIALDSDTSLLPGSDQQRWLAGQLQHLPPSTRFVFISLHHPPVADFQTRTNVSHNPRPNEIALGNYLESIAPGIKAKIIISAGHIHNYERFEQNGVVYFVSGGGAATPVPVDRGPADLYQEKSFPNYHFVQFTLVRGELQGKMFRVADPGGSSSRYEEKDAFSIPPVGR